MPRKTKIRRPRRRVMRGGRLSHLGENNINALNRISVGENNLNAIAALQEPLPPLQPTGQIVNLPYPVTGTVPLLDRIRGALKRSKLISRSARALKFNRIADFAEQHGYGHRRRRKRHRGRGPTVLDKYGSYVHAF